MKRRSLACLMMALMMALSGCSASMQVENQAYAIVMGLDREDDGRMRMCVQIPKIAGSSEESQSSASGSGSGNYIRLEVRAEDFNEALEQLNWAAPRRLNLSQLKLIVLSQTLAREQDNAALLRDIAQTERLFTAARVAVCEGSACDFVAAIAPSMGLRMSADLESTLKYDQEYGFIPEGYLAELHYQTESVYSDPLAIYAVLRPTEAEGAEKAQASFAFDRSTDALSEDNASEIPTRYLGAAVFANGQMCGTLNGQQTIFANLLRNALESFNYNSNGQSIGIVPVRATFISVDTSAEPVRIRVSARLSIAAQDAAPDEARLRRDLIRDIEDVFRTAQQMGAEPFGIAEKAAAHFTTVGDWVAYNWRERFQEARLEVELHFSHSGA